MSRRRRQDDRGSCRRASSASMEAWHGDASLILSPDVSNSDQSGGLSRCIRRNPARPLAVPATV
jgi:hypothetical protein